MFKFAKIPPIYREFIDSEVKRKNKKFNGNYDDIVDGLTAQKFIGEYFGINEDFVGEYDSGSDLKIGEFHVDIKAVDKHTQ